MLRHDRPLYLHLRAQPPLHWSLIGSESDESTTPGNSAAEDGHSDTCAKYLMLHTGNIA